MLRNTPECIDNLPHGDASRHLQQILSNTPERFDNLPHGNASRHLQQILSNTPECIDNLPYGNASRHLEQTLRDIHVQTALTCPSFSSRPPAGGRSAAVGP